MTELFSFPAATKNTFTFLTPHPQKRLLHSVLASQGWKEVPVASQAHLILAFSMLHDSMRPSFTYIRGGQIKDLRSRKLRSLWDQMGQNSLGSSSLTTIGFRADLPLRAQGKFAVVYQDGRLNARVPLNRTEQRTWQTRAGSLTVQVKQGIAKIITSPCRHQICRCTPPISLSGERIICAPSHFFLEIQGAPGLDTVIG